MDEVERDILQISEERITVGNKTIKELVHKAINTIEARRRVAKRLLEAERYVLA